MKLTNNDLVQRHGVWYRNGEKHYQTYPADRTLSAAELDELERKKREYLNRLP